MPKVVWCRYYYYYCYSGAVFSTADVQCIGHDRSECDSLPTGVQVTGHASRGACGRHRTERAAFNDNGGTVLPATCVGHGTQLPRRFHQPQRRRTNADIFLHAFQVCTLARCFVISLFRSQLRRVQCRFLYDSL